ncbi:hypothetical protein WL34_25140 [Burkholderia cepacia]|nr:hypothetical protein WL34_25140 [Burkholderia cepacia]
MSKIGVTQDQFNFVLASKKRLQFNKKIHSTFKFCVNLYARRILVVTRKPFVFKNLEVTSKLLIGPIRKVIKLLWMNPNFFTAIPEILNLSSKNYQCQIAPHFF